MKFGKNHRERSAWSKLLDLGCSSPRPTRCFVKFGHVPVMPGVTWRKRSTRSSNSRGSSPSSSALTGCLLTLGFNNLQLTHPLFRSSGPWSPARSVRSERRFHVCVLSFPRPVVRPVYSIAALPIHRRRSARAGSMKILHKK